MALRTGHGVAIPSFDELDIVMRTDPLLYTWQYAIMRILAANNFELKMIESFDVNAFLENKEGYLLSYLGEEVGRDQIEKSDLEIVEHDLRSIMRSQPDVFVTKEPSLTDLENHIRDGWYCLCNVNQKILQADEGYVGHMLFVYGTSWRGPRLHNPGPPASRGTEIAWDLFNRAWSYPTSNARNLLAVRYRGK
jgi:hypothetical protein